MATHVLPYQHLFRHRHDEMAADSITTDYVDLPRMVATHCHGVGQAKAYPLLEDVEVTETLALKDEYKAILPNQDQAQQLAQLKCLANEEAANHYLNPVLPFDAYTRVTTLRPRTKQTKLGRSTCRLSLRMPVHQQPARSHRSRPVRSKSASSSNKSSSDSDGPAPGSSHLTHLTSRSTHEQATSRQEVRQ